MTVDVDMEVHRILCVDARNGMERHHRLDGHALGRCGFGVLFEE
jgi:hypothetical protein